MQAVFLPLAIRPRAIVKVSALSTNDVKAPAGWQVLELVILTARLCFLLTLLLYWDQAWHTHNTDLQSIVLQRADEEEDHLPGSS